MSLPKSAHGIAYALAAYVAWGLVPLFWKVLVHVPAPELVSHRVVWSLVFVVLALAWQKRLPEMKAILRDRKKLAWMTLSTALISINWGLYIWAVIVGNITQASLGYYINPLVNVLLARVFLGERLRPAQLVAVAIAAVGVSYMAVQGGEVPWIALTLAASFGVYGLIRKQTPMLPLPGLAVETLIAAPVAMVLLGARGFDGTWAFATSTPIQIAFVFAAGAVTAMPLLWFAHAARLLRYSTLGVIQYITPTMQLILAVLVFGEAFTPAHSVTFGFIWTGIAVYALDAVLAQRKMARAVVVAPPG